MVSQIIDMKANATYFEAHLLSRQEGLAMAPHRSLDRYMMQGLNARPEERGFPEKINSAARELLGMSKPGEAFKKADLVDKATKLRVPLDSLLRIGDDKIFEVPGYALLIDPQNFTRRVANSEVSLFEKPELFLKSDSLITIHPANMTLVSNIAPPGELIFHFGRVHEETGLPIAVDSKERDSIPEDQRRALSFNGANHFAGDVFPGGILYVVRGLKGYVSEKEINITLRDFQHPFNVLAVEPNSK